jgi:hypothetical protein
LRLLPDRNGRKTGPFNVHSEIEEISKGANICNSGLKTDCLTAMVVIGSTAIASAQGGSTDRNGNAVGSQHIGNGTSGAMHNGAHATTGMNSDAARDNPNGSPGSAPKAKEGPQGDPSRDNDAPK